MPKFLEKKDSPDNPQCLSGEPIRHTHFSRNPKIAEYLKAYDYVKEFGEGVDRMCRELSAIGTKEPQYHLVAFIMKASVWANVLEEGQEKTISDQKRPESDQIKMILELIKEKPQISRSEISHKMGLHESSVKRRLKMMVDKGIIQRIGSDRGGHWKISNN